MKRFKRLKKIILWTGGSLLGLILTLALLGYIFEDRIHLYAIQELGRALNARIEVRETDVSFIRSFPSVRVELQGLTINPVEGQPNPDVIAVENATLTLDFWSMFSDKYEISGVHLQQPRVWMEHDKQGNLNFADMFQPVDSTPGSDGDSSAFHLALRRVRVSEGEFRYRDLRSGQHVRLDSIHIDLDGDFSADQSGIEARAALRLDNWYNGRLSWFTDKHLALDAELDATFGQEARYLLREGRLRVADVDLDLKGGLQREGKAHRIDLAFASNQASFKSFLSLLPGGLLETGREYEYSGDFRAEGSLKGRFGADEIPVLHMAYAVERGAFHYTGYDARLTDVAMTGSLHYDSKRPAISALLIDDFIAKLRGRALTGHFHYTDFSAPLIAFKLNGGVGLEDVRDFYPSFADSSDLRGLVRADLEVEGRLDAFKEKRYRDIRAIGSMQFDSLRIEDPRLQNPVERLSGSVVLDNQRLQVNRLAGKIGSSDFDAKGTLTEYLSWIFDDTARVTGAIELKSKRLAADEWFAAQPGTDAPAATEQPYTFSLPRGLDLQARVDIGQFQLAKFNAQNVRGLCRLAGNTLNLETLTMQTLAGNLQVAGKLAVESESRCKVNMSAIAAGLDINQAFTTFDQLAAFALVKDHLKGTYSGDLTLSGSVNQYLDLDPASLLSSGNVSLTKAQLIDFEPLQGLAGFVKMDDLRFIEFSDIHTAYRIEGQYFYIPQMKVNANRYNLTVSGRHGFDNSLDYKVWVEMPRKEATRSRNQKVLDYIETEQPDPIKVVIPVRITGTVDAPKFALEGDYVAAKVEEAVQKQKDDLKTGFRNETDALFGARKDTFEVDDLIEVNKPVKDTTKKGVMDKWKDPLKKVKLPKQLGGALNR